MARRRNKDSQESKKRKKKNSSILEYEIMKIMEHCLKTAIDNAVNSVFKDFK